MFQSPDTGCYVSRWLYSFASIGFAGYILSVCEENPREKLIFVCGEWIDSMVRRFKCYKERCGHTWNSKSTAPFYVTCPHCYSKLNVKRALVSNGSSPEIIVPVTSKPKRLIDKGHSLI